MSDKYSKVIEKLNDSDHLRSASSVVRNHVGDIKKLNDNGIKLKTIHQELFLAGAKLTFQVFKNVYYKNKKNIKKQIEPITRNDSTENSYEEIKINDRGERVNNSVTDLDRLAEEMFKKTEKNNLNIFK